VANIKAKRQTQIITLKEGLKERKKERKKDL
jgi:hypothetical protein